MAIYIKITNEYIYWYKNGIPHREDGPAEEYCDGSKYWLRYGKLHREDGPAIEIANGFKRWYLDNVQYTQEEFIKETNKQ